MKIPWRASSVVLSKSSAPHFNAKWVGGIAVLCLCLFFAVATKSQRIGAYGTTAASSGQQAVVKGKNTPTYTSFEAPGAGTGAFEGTLGLSINTAQDITGFYLDSKTVAHGFVRAGTGGAIVTFDSPDAGTGKNEGTFPATINNAGTIAGSYHDANDVYHGFVRTSAGVVTEFDAPGAGTTAHRGTTPISMNTAGAITGVYNDENAVRHGFVRAAKKGAITTFDVPGAGTGSTQGTVPFSINTAGTITGTYSDTSGVFHGFVRTSKGVITTVNVPSAQETIALSINAAGDVAGTYSAGSGCQGFEIVKGTMTTFEIPGAGTGACALNHVQLQGTIPVGVNTAGDVTGTYEDANMVFHGFERTPAKGVITTFDVPGAGTSAIQGSVPVGINAAQDITGVYVDASGMFHGFLRTPK
jgi:hypothetical protein